MTRHLLAFVSAAVTLLGPVACGSAGASSSSGDIDSGTTPSDAGHDTDTTSGDAAKPCTDTILNQDETDIDCGGATCKPYPDAMTCKAATDCASGVCDILTKKCAQNPTFSRIVPNVGSTAGATVVTITGTNFATTGPVNVTIGGVAATVVTATATSLTCSTGANLGKAGLADVVITNPNTGTVTGKDKYTYFFGTVSVAGASDTAQSTNPMQPVFVDVNKDGKLDIVMSSWSSSTVYTRLGHGDGTFGAPSVLNSIIGRVRDPRFGDINGDGTIDLLVAGEGSSVMIALGHGDGTFAAGIDIPMGAGITYSCDLADFNGDKNLDIVAGNAKGGATIRLGRGDGTFAAAATTAVGPGGYVVRAFDLNKDGKQDLIAGGYDTGTIGVALGHGDGTFNVQTNIATDAFEGVDVGDLNGDGRVDIVFATGSAPASLFVALANTDGTFATPVGLDGGGATAAKIVDIDGDGQQDIVVVQYTSLVGTKIKMLLGRGDGTFKPATTLMRDVGNRAIGFALGDLNNDGRLDIGVADFYANILHIALNNSQ